MSAVSSESLTDFCRDLFIGAGAPGPVAAIVAKSLVYADLRGVESHGVLRSEIYIKRMSEGMIDPHAPVEIVQDSGTTALLDGGNHFGVFVGLKALDACMERALVHGICALGVRHSNHFGTGAYYVERAVEKGLALIVMSNAPQTMPATGGVKPFLGTNPIAFGFPTDCEVPFILDMATSHVARGKIIIAAKRGDDIPLGWAVDSEGRPTTNAQEALDGAVLPMGGAKGSGLSMAIDILSGVLTGAGFGPSVHNIYNDWEKPQNVGHFFLAIDIERFIGLETFKARMGEFIDQLKAQPKASGVEEILYAGELEHRLQVKRISEGLSLADELRTDLERLGRTYGVSWPEEISAAS